ncbi:MAG: hypothetical protein KJ593_02050 [Candidatus Omnitrophica bacterium]|nr:hypothetical protein [Candidatus Omnitrophota bacterium]
MNKINKYFLFSVSCALLLVFLSGCARVSVKEPNKIYNFQDAGYYALETLCELNNISWSWDYLTEVATLKRRAHLVKIRLESELALLDDKPIDLGKPVIMRDSRLLVPVSFKTLIIDRLF